MRATRLLLVLPVVAALSPPAADAAACVNRGRRCSTPPTRPTEEARALAAARLGAGERVVVPVVYHILHSSFLDDRGMIADRADLAPSVALMHHQTRALNRAFRGTGFSFVTEEATLRDFAPWWSAQRLGQRPMVVELTAMVHDLTRNRRESLHVFLLQGADNRAAAPETRSLYPETADAADTDVILMEWDFLPYVPSLYRLYPKEPPRWLRRYYFEGETLVHLVGHYFGLLHTYEALLVNGAELCDPKCAQTTDYVRDTPAHRSTGVSGLCIPTDTCKGLPGMDPMTNYMNGEPDLCASEFTPGQVERMERLLRLYRPNFIVPAGAGEH